MVHETTRMVKARAVLANPEGRLRHGMFAEARVTTVAELAGLAAPETAVQYIDGLPVVFVRHADDLFEARRVRTGLAQGGRISILDSLLPKEPIAVAETYLLKS